MSTFLYGAHIQANGIRQHYLRYGGRGPAVVLVPGITSPAVTWGFVAEHFGQHFDTYVLDVRGRGLSASGDSLSYAMTDCVDDIGCLVQALGLSAYHLVGHSMGARFAMLSAIRYPEGLARLVLLDLPVSGPGRRAYPSQLSWYVESITQAQGGMDLADMRVFCPSWTEPQLRLRAQWLHTCHLPAVEQAFTEFHEVDVHQYFALLTVPTLLMMAGRGDVISAEDEREINLLQPAIRLVRVPSAGHMLPWDDLPAFLQAFGDFLGPRLASGNPAAPAIAK